MRKPIHIHAQINKNLYTNIIQSVPITMVTKENLKSMNVKTVLDVHSVHYVPKQKKVIIEN